VRCLSAALKKKEKDAAKKRQIRKALEHEALNRHRRQQRLEGLPVKESPSETASEEDEDEDSDDNGVESRYDTVTFIVHLPDVRRGVDLPGVEGGGRASGRKGPRGAFREGIRHAWGPSDDVSGAVPTRPIVPDLVGGQADDVVT
jgi:hypothetical protein